MENVQDTFCAAHAQRLYKILFTKRVRLGILLSWHCNNPVKSGKSIRNIWKEFIRVLLYCPPDLCLTHDALYPFGSHYSGFCIPLTKWPKEVVQLVYLLFKERRRLFTSVQEFPHGKFHCSGFAYSKTKHMLPDAWRRSMLLTFCFYMETQPQLHWYRSAMYHAIQDLCLCDERGHGDVFLCALSRALRGMCKLSEIQTWGNFVGDYPPVIISDANYK